jgi:hypothetical protein
MKPDAMLVEPHHIISARQHIASKGNADALTEVGQVEPALASFISESLVTVAGKLALSGAPTEVVLGSHEEFLLLVLTCIQAVRRGHYELWKESMTGTRLAQLDKEFQAPPKRRRKKRPDPEAPTANADPGT